MNRLVAAFPGRELHVILDNLNTHKRNERWLKKHPNVWFLSPRRWHQTLKNCILPEDYYLPGDLQAHLTTDTLMSTSSSIRMALPSDFVILAVREALKLININ